jgi:glucose/arabinose dehydrogenase
MPCSTRLVPALLLLVSGALAAQPPLAPREVERVFDFVDLVQPVFLTHAGDGSGLLYVVEQPGRVQVIDPGPGSGAGTARLFLDHTAAVNNGPGEAGLLGLAFHPDYETNRRVYLSYTHGSLTSRVAEFTVSGDPAVIDAASERVLLDVDQPAGNHNGGQIDFGPDGMLYVALGDGGASGDRFGNGQNPETLLGSILRIDVDTRTGDLPYGIPADNPFVGNPDGWREEIWAWGLRNPWRFSFDRATGELWAGDVGQNAFEEIDIIRRGGNYGWNTMEGFTCYAASTCDRDGLQLPVLQYDRNAGISVTGGYVYRGRQLGDLHGAYVYADFGTRTVWAIRHDGATVTDSTQLLRAPANVSSFGQDEAGELYLVGYDGTLWRFLPLPGEQPVTTAVTRVDAALPAGLQLAQNYPNPFNPSTTIRFDLPAAGDVELTVYDVLGRRVTDLARGWHEAGAWRATWDGRDAQGRSVAAGVYHYRLRAGGEVLTQRMILVE